MTKFQDGKWWDSNLLMDVYPIPRSPPYPLRHRLPKVIYHHAETGRPAASIGAKDKQNTRMLTLKSIKQR
ncbi:hypothetical protein E2C01_015952 [Portunus trituberculatus]|uniref:Uncharacterized protein n=1 Tax=Portunus trituberculatus TaxID=210409 RepID=A0A5B7DPP0_PORTR|nr:hypothetical protein [Portunus trituberculatus]